MALDDSTRAALPFIRGVWPSCSYEIDAPVGERGMQDLTVKWRNDGGVVRRIEVKGRGRRYGEVFWNWREFDYDRVPSPDATSESYADGDTVDGVPPDLEGCDTIYILNAENKDGKFMPPTDGGKYAAKWAKVRDYGWDIVVAAEDAFWYVSAPEMRRRFRGYGWHNQRGTTLKTCVYNQDSEKRPRIMALFDFDGLPYATQDGKDRYLWHGDSPPDFIMEGGER